MLSLSLGLDSAEQHVLSCVRDVRALESAGQAERERSVLSVQRLRMSYKHGLASVHQVAEQAAELVDECVHAFAQAEGQRADERKAHAHAQQRQKRQVLRLLVKYWECCQGGGRGGLALLREAFASWRRYLEVMGEVSIELRHALAAELSRLPSAPHANLASSPPPGEQLQEEEARAQARTVALKLEKSTLQKSLEELQDELADFQRTSEENLAQVAKQYEQKIKDAMESVDNQNAQAETAKLQQQLKQADHALAAAQAELEKAHAKVLEADQAHASDKKQFVLLEEKVASLEHALTTAQAELEKAHAKLLEANQAHASDQKQFVLLEEKAASLGHALAAAQAELEKALTEVLEANQAHASEKKESLLLAEKMARLELMCRDIERGHTQLEVAHRSAKERLHRTEKALKRVEEEVGVTQIDLAEAQEIIAQLNEDTAEKANESAELLARCSILENEKVALSEKNSSLLAAVKGSETELKDVKGQLILCQQDLSAKCSEEGAARAELNSGRADLQAIDSMARLIAGDNRRLEAPADSTSPTPGTQQDREGLRQQDGVGEVQQMLARYESATRAAEEMAANSAEELAACRRQLAHEGKEIDLVLSEIGELQQAVEAQGSELASAYERIRQLEGGSAKTSAHAEQAPPTVRKASLGNLFAAAKGRNNKAVIASHREG